MKRTVSNIKKSNKANTRIKVIVHSYTDVTQEADPDDAWSSDSTHTHNTFTAFKVCKSKEGFDLIIPYTLVKERDYYLVVATYSTGDSFSSHSGRYEIIDMYSSYDRADAVAKHIEKDYYDNNNNFSFGFINCKGELQKISCPWKGYFESLDDVSVINIRMI